jgi:hypothetical protein
MDETCFACDLGTLIYHTASDLYECNLCGFTEEEFERVRRLQETAR